MAKPVKPIPEGFHTLTPHLVVRDASQAIEFYKRAFGAEVLSINHGPEGKSVMHAEVKIRDSILMLIDELPAWKTLSPLSLGGTGVTIHMYVEDADAAFEQAVSAGATVGMPLMDAFWGDRYGTLVDPFGHEWSLATHKEDLSPEEIKKRGEAFFAKQGAGMAKQGQG